MTKDSAQSFPALNQSSVIMYSLSAAQAAPVSAHSAPIYDAYYP